jgi:hypothetical protein
MRMPLFFVLLLALAGCSPSSQALKLNTGGAVSAGTVDSNPVAVLPTGALFVSSLDAQALFRSSFAPQIRRLVQNLLPVGAESRFQPARDLLRVYAAFYAMQGADFCAVLQGRFDVAALRAAALAGSRTPSGKILQIRRYAQFEVYQVGELAFVPLTQRTVVSGNRTGLRRALDRLRFGTSGSELQPWMAELLASSKAPAVQTQPTAAAAAQRPAFVVVGDVTSQAVVAATSERLPFLSGLQLVRVLGNFQAPGMNLVGSVSYGDKLQAQKGAAALAQMQQFAYFMSLMSAFGVGGRMPKLEVKVQGRDVAFAAPIDAGLVRLLLAVAINATQG